MRECFSLYLVLQDPILFPRSCQFNRRIRILGPEHCESGLIRIRNTAFLFLQWMLLKTCFLAVNLCIFSAKHCYIPSRPAITTTRVADPDKDLNPTLKNGSDLANNLSLYHQHNFGQYNLERDTSIHNERKVRFSGPFQIPDPYPMFCSDPDPTKTSGYRFAPLTRTSTKFRREAPLWIS